MLYFDAWTCIGPYLGKHPSQPWSLDDVLSEMEHCSISAALVASSMSVRYDALWENRRLTERLRQHPNLAAVWNAYPHWTGEFPEPDEFVERLHDHDVRAVTLNPNGNGWPLLSPTSRPLLDALAQQQMLTIMDFAEFASSNELEDLLRAYPDLPLLVHGISWAAQRRVTPLLVHHRNLHITFDHYQINRGLERLVELGCEQQLLFGSNAPRMSMGAHRTYLDYADIEQTAKERIAAGNLTRLLKGLSPPHEVENPSEDHLMAAVRKGEPLSGLVLDMHCHMLDEGLNGGGGHYTMTRGGPSGIAELMQRVGCDGAGIMSWSGTVGGDADAGNDCVIDALNALPDSCWGLATFDPTHTPADELPGKVSAFYSDPRFLGMKPYRVYGLPYDAPAYECWWEFGDRHHLYALIHRTRSDFSEVTNLAQRYPNANWVAAHCGASYAVADAAIAAARKAPNIYLEITLTPVTLGVIEYLVAGAGADRVIYGSDQPMRDPRQQLGWVVFSNLPVDIKERVLGLNAEGILKQAREHTAERVGIQTG